ncbi:heat shock cognate 70 kDa protein-like protein [Tanacetum coccineum]
MSPENVAREGIPFELFRSTYPGRHVARETDYTSVVDISVYQGEGVKVKDNKLLGMFNFNGLTLGADGNSELEVRFSLDIYGILRVSAEEVSTGHKNSVTISKF